MRRLGSLSPEVLYRVRQYFRIKNVYHSNAIEGNVLGVGETRQVIERGLTITGVPLKDQAEARNLSHALDFLETLASDTSSPITAADVRQLHKLVLDGLHDEAGAYRSVPVEISGSKHLPPGPEAVPSEMEGFGRWLSYVSVPDNDAFATVSGLIVAAVAHTWFVTIHPFIDGNGRVARLLLNLILMRYGYPIAIITKDDRDRYYDALEGSHTSDLTQFVNLLSECIEESLEEYETAANEQREQTEWAASLAKRFTQPERVRAENEYEVWKNAMELLKSHLQQTVDMVNQASEFGSVYLKDFGNLEFEKYSALRRGGSAKRTWFFRVDFVRGGATARYLFFFGHASYKMRGRCDVTLRLARENPPNSFHYERLENIRTNSGTVPNLAEVGYEMSKERFVVQPRHGATPRISRVEEFTKQFFEEVVASHFDGVNPEPVVMGNNDLTRLKKEVQRAAVAHIKASDKALLLSVLGSTLRTEFENSMGGDWFGTGSLSAFIREIGGTSGIQINDVHVWDATIHEEPEESRGYSIDLPQFIEKICSDSDFPKMGRDCWQDTFTLLEQYATDTQATEDREFSLTDCTKTIVDRLREMGHSAPGFRDAIGYIVKGALRGGTSLTLQPAPTADQIRASFIYSTKDYLELDSGTLTQLGDWLQASPQSTLAPTGNGKEEHSDIEKQFNESNEAPQSFSYDRLIALCNFVCLGAPRPSIRCLDLESVIRPNSNNLSPLDDLDGKIGVYAFQDDSELMYVGKCEIADGIWDIKQRVAQHLRERDTGGTFRRNWLKKHPDKNFACFQAKLGRCRLWTIAFPSSGDAEKIRRLEHLIIGLFAPRYCDIGA